MNKEDKKKDFVKRCNNLAARLTLIRQLTESSSRVWVSTLGVILCEICKNQDRPKAAFDEFVSGIQETWEKLDG